MPQPHLPLGIPLMDEDHAALEALFADVATTADADLATLARTIVTEVTAHFGREEQLMEKAQVPILNCHRAQHAALLSEAAELLRAATTSEALRLVLGLHLPQLVEGHVASVDRVSSEFLRGKMAPMSFDNLRLPDPAPVA